MFVDPSSESPRLRARERTGGTEAKRLGRLEIDDQLELGRLLDWKIGWLGLPLRDLWST
jgi:hypothetical protein